MIKTFSGTCLLNNSETSIDISYISYCSIENQEPSYSKERFSCKNAGNCQYAKNHTCSIYNNAPEII